ncbi:MAG: hypothetical protein LBP53_05780 [Candidatus Peribacteria bacterium]|jgi:hypothetical protein|nr:hypothetical protein [Candidatus Peribacteria bacterium]
MVAYHANKGELSTGIYYNTLALKLADKYLSTYVSLVNASMAASCLNTAMDTTQYLLTHYELSSTDKATLLDTYHTLLHTDKITAFQHILKGEYHTMTDFLHQFTVTAPDEIGIIDSTNSPMRSFTSNNIFSIRLFKPPFYDAQATKTRFAYALKELAEGIRNGKSSEKILKEV